MITLERQLTPVVYSLICKAYVWHFNGCDGCVVPSYAALNKAGVTTRQFREDGC